jgi:hypothetical protein
LRLLFCIVATQHSASLFCEGFQFRDNAVEFVDEWI